MKTGFYKFYQDFFCGGRAHGFISEVRNLIKIFLTSIPELFPFYNANSF
jgi:hypothetical protein